MYEFRLLVPKVLLKILPTVSPHHQYLEYKYSGPATKLCSCVGQKYFLPLPSKLLISLNAN